MTPGRYYMRLQARARARTAAPDQHADPRRGDRHRLHLAFLFRPELPPAVRPPALRGAAHDLLTSLSLACVAEITVLLIVDQSPPLALCAPVLSTRHKSFAQKQWLNRRQVPLWRNFWAGLRAPARSQKSCFRRSRSCGRRSTLKSERQPKRQSRVAPLLVACGLSFPGRRSSPWSEVSQLALLTGVFDVTKNRDTQSTNFNLKDLEYQYSALACADFRG